MPTKVIILSGSLGCARQRYWATRARELQQVLDAAQLEDFTVVNARALARAG
jgi:hypothetical protein